MRRLKTPPDSIRDDLSYDKETGKFYWVKNGVEAGTNMVHGYRQICYKGVLYLAHRLAFFLVEGAMPPEYVDHINGQPGDNRWDNLRQCSKVENAHNVVAWRHTKHGLPIGVMHNGKNRYTSKIRYNGVTTYLGQHDTPEEAGAAYLKAKAEKHLFNPTVRYPEGHTRPVVELSAHD